MACAAVSISRLETGSLCGEPTRARRHADAGWARQSQVLQSLDPVSFGRFADDDHWGGAEPCPPVEAEFRAPSGPQPENPAPLKGNLTVEITAAGCGRATIIRCFTPVGAIKHYEFPVVGLQHDLGRVAFLVVLIGPFAGLQ